MEYTKETFVETETQKKILKILERDNCLIMIAKGGRGKTALGLQLASIFKDKEFTPVYLVNNEIKTMRDIIDFKSKNFIIVDDLFEQTHSYINKHTLKVIYDSVRSDNCQSKFILNIREIPHCNPSILESRDYSILREIEVINLDDETYGLSQSEKNEILLKHMKKFNVLCHCNGLHSKYNECEKSVYTDPNDQSLTVCRLTVEKIIKCQTLEGFPEACHMFCSDKTLTVLGLSYFKNTSESLVSKIKHLSSSGFGNTETKYQYSTLVYVALKGKIDLKCLDESLLLRILQYYEQKDIRIKEYKGALVSKAVHDLSLNGKYLVKDRKDKTYCFQHATIQEAVLISYGEECFENLISSCHFCFFMEYIRPKSEEKFKKPNHVFLFVSDDALSNSMLSLFQHNSDFCGLSKPLLEVQENNKMLLTERDDRYHVDKPCSIDHRFNYTLFGNHLFYMMERNNHYSFVNLFLSKLCTILESEKIDLDVMKFFIDGFIQYGMELEAVLTRYSDFFTKYLFEYGSPVVIVTCCVPLSQADKYRMRIPVDNTLLLKKLIELFFNTWNHKGDKEISDRFMFARTISLCFGKDLSHKINKILLEIGKYLHTTDPDFVNFILFQVIGISKDNYIDDAFMMKSLLDGLTGKGKKKEVIIANFSFFYKWLFKYGSTPVVVSLCRPSSYKGSDDVIFKVDNHLLANKLIENFKNIPREELLNKYFQIWKKKSFLFKSEKKKFLSRPSISNCAYFFFEGSGYFDMRYFNDIARYIFQYGVLENDEEFIEAVTTAIYSLRNAEEEECNTFNSKIKDVSKNRITQCENRLKKFVKSFSKSNIRKMSRKCPSLLDSLSISYDADELSSDSDDNLDTNNTEHEDDDIHELETHEDFDRDESDKYEDSGSNELDIYEDSGGMSQIIMKIMAVIRYIIRKIVEVMS